MRTILLVSWLLLPIGAWAYHEGPGQDRVALESTDAVLARAHEAFAKGSFKAAVREYEAALKAAHVRYEVYQYAGTQHGFNNDTTPRFNAEAAKLAWGRTIAFFKQHLG